ncbi:MAG: dipeptide epimerase [Thermoplasmata archaeon]|nr:dipeptide epimerase [Thermoplasmata archaeon]
MNKRASTFRIATGSSDQEENVLVKVRAGGLYGIGAANPTDVTHETLESVQAFLMKVPKKVVGTDESDIMKLHKRLDAIAPGNTAAKAAVDCAVHDLLAKGQGKPLHSILGTAGRSKVLTDMTIGIETKDVTVKKAVHHYKKGFRALKVKVGLDLEGDIRRVAAVRDAVGPKVELRVDANQGYSVEQAIRFCEEMATIGVVVVEQPVKAEDLVGLKRVTEASRVDIMADECVRSLAEAKKVVEDRTVDMINIKLMKSAGLHGAVAIDRLAADAGISTMVGCMGELQVSIAAGLHFALSSDNVRYADLDSEDRTSGLEFEDGHLLAPKGPGLGISTPLDG